LTGTPSGRLGMMISEKGLRYDLTVPFARYVVQHRSEITFPFKRYQIQPVWRADRPQRGRYREFYQCDVDVIGSNSLLNEYELVRIMDQVFAGLGLGVLIRLNNRKILTGIVEVIGESGRMTDITVAIDKLEKIGIKKVMTEMEQKGVGREALDRLVPVLELKGGAKEKLGFLGSYLAATRTGTEGVEEMKELLGFLEEAPVKAGIEFDMTLARGLDYYTGTIFEVNSTEAQIGSICGGGRYDDLTGIFGLEGVSGVGVSFGADRIYDVMEQLDRFPRRGSLDTQVLFVNFGERECRFILPVLDRLRAVGTASELYPDAAKMKKQLSYAHQRNIPYVALVGEKELAEGRITLKEMETGKQESYLPDQLLAKFNPDL
jgi:histidyl-tRNA synthetase